MKCNHEWYEREAALIDGMCPLCLSNNIVDGVSAADRVALLRADVERLADAQSALRYIESRYGRLDGVGLDRVLSPDSATHREDGSHG